MSQTPHRPPCEILKETFAKLQFKLFAFDNVLALEPSSRKLLDDYVRDFYYFKLLNGAKDRRGKRAAFRRKYHKNPGLYPNPIQPDLISTATLSLATPGEAIDRNAFLGYFKDLKDPSGRYFSDFTGAPVESLPAFIEPVRRGVKQLAAGLPENDTKRETLTLYDTDIALLLDLCRFVPKLFYYASENRLPQLKTGHLIALVSGMQKYFAYLEKFLLETGLAGTTLDADKPLYADVERLNAKLVIAVRAMVIDLTIPLSLAGNLRIDWVKDELVLSPAMVIKRSFLSDLIDFFKRKPKDDKKPEPKPKQKTATAEPPAPAKDKPAAEKSADNVIDSRMFVEMRATVEKFASELRTDLEPEKNERGEVTDYKSMFDQFDVPPEARDLTFTRFVLRGRLRGVDPTDYRYQDQTIISSTHWLYDRLRDIAERYRFSAAPLTRIEADSFVDAMRGLFFIGKNEPDETKRYGNFPQFRISMKRLFSSDAKQTKYNGMINALSDMMDKTRDEMDKIWKR